MNQYNEISTLQYMGSKTRIISHICEPIIKNKSIKTVVDLFAGTGSTSSKAANLCWQNTVKRGYVQQIEKHLLFVIT